MVKVFKFGGASVNSVERIHNTANIIQQYANEKGVIIVSAMGKTTNALEKVAEAFYAGNKEESLRLFEVVKGQHLTTAKYLLVTNYNNCLSQLTDFFTEVEWLLHDKPVKPFDYYYDQVVCVGELLSTCIISYYLNEKGIKNTWLDVRDVVRTDNNFRDATIDWKTTENKAKTNVLPLLQDGNIIVTQGFIGSTDENESTTLGREGSDFTAAIFANILNAESLTIWKDVEGVMNADPRRFEEAQLMSELSFDEVIEMAYYGAQVIHPKTIKPLQNKSIPLHVKCFLNPSLNGTTISKKGSKQLPPIIIVKENQALLHLRSHDFSFVGEAPMSKLYEMFGELRLKPNLIQTGAISVQLCIDDKSDKVSQLAAAASSVFDVQVERNLSLLTIRHFTDEIIDKMLQNKTIVLRQQTKETIQILYQ
ncbi:MAG: aspartate kinase [Bacteroidota bacterium]|nr:aspartate kinase [Bacteroidota bacterium]